MAESPNRITALLATRRTEILEAWVGATVDRLGARAALVNREDLARQSRDLLDALAVAFEPSDLEDTEAPAYRPVLGMLEDISISRTRQGFSPSETASYVFTLKDTLLRFLREAHPKGSDALAEELLRVSRVMDALGLVTFEAYVRGREAVISRQQQELMELSTPVIKVWDGVLTLPLIGTLDSARTQVVMESLLQAIVATGASIAILDISGVPAVDTLVAQHLIKTVSATRLMGAECIISGIRPEIAQTIVSLGVDLGGIRTKGSLAEALKVALRSLGQRVVRDDGRPDRA